MIRGLLCALVYLPLALGPTVDLIDAVRGAGNLALCGCDGSDCCCGAPCCAPETASCCEPEPSCCEPPPVEGRVRFDVACTCGLDDARDRALVLGGDVHAPPAGVPLPAPADADHAGLRAGPGRPVRALDPPEPVPKSSLLA